MPELFLFCRRAVSPDTGVRSTYFRLGRKTAVDGTHNELIDLHYRRECQIFSVTAWTDNNHQAPRLQACEMYGGPTILHSLLIASTDEAC